MNRFAQGLLVGYAVGAAATFSGLLVQMHECDTLRIPRAWLGVGILTAVWPVTTFVSVGEG